mmetsp:Transcript_38783/g.71416  ORF Transcript_38783/g.71416 Transcript_38783/m.71416 type:complete len:241 (-) Transcript_38783:86-808(-)
MYEVHGVSTNILPVFLMEIIPSFQNTPMSLLVVGAIERWITTEQDVGYHAYRPQIARFAVSFPQYLWRDVIRGAHESAHRRLPIFAMLSRQTKINDLDRRVEIIGSLEQNILGLDVSVCDVAFVHVGQGREDLVHDSRRLVLAKARAVIAIRRSFDNLVKELSAVTHICDQVDVLEIFVYINERHDVAMLHFTQQRDLTGDAGRPDFWVILANGLDGTSPTGDAVDAFSHAAVVAAAEDS